MAYKPGDRIFAKVKGHPHWPARINLLPEDVPIPKGKYPIFFYGTYEVYFLAPKDIFPYEKFKHKYAIARNRPVFQKGLVEIEKDPDVLLYGKDANAEDFLSQFYKFQRSAAAPSQPPAPAPAPPSPKPEPSGPEAKSPPPPSAITSPPAKTTPAAKATTPKQAKKRPLSSSKKSEPPAKRKNLTPAVGKKSKTKDNTPAPALASTNSSLADARKSSSGEVKRLVSPIVESEETRASAKRPSESSKVETPASGHTKEANEASKKGTEGAVRRSSVIMQPIKIRQKMGFPATDFTESVPELTSTAPKQEAPVKTTSLGRPMRKSASQFSARRLLKSRASELAHLGTSDSSTDEDWNPMGHAQESSPSSSPLSGGPVASSQRSSLPKKPQKSSEVGTATAAAVSTLKTVEIRKRRSRRFSGSRSHLRAIVRDLTPDVSTPTTTTTTTTSAVSSSPSSPSASSVSSTSSTSSSANRVFHSHRHHHRHLYQRRHPHSSNHRERFRTVRTKTKVKKRESVAEDSCSPTVSSTTPHPPSSKHHPRPSSTHDGKSNSSKVGDPNSAQKQLKELSTEARLLLLDRAIKSTLIQGQEDIQACLRRLESLEKLDVSLPILAKCWTVIETLRKCRRYKRSLEVKISAQKVFNHFVSIYTNASAEDLDLAHAELMAHNQRLADSSNPSSSSAPLGPKSMADLFQVGAPSAPAVTTAVCVPQELPTAKVSSPSEVKQLVASPLASLPEVTSTTSNFAPSSNVPAEEPSSREADGSREEEGEEEEGEDEQEQEVAGGAATEEESQTAVPKSSVAALDSDSEGLAPSLGGLDGEESEDLDSDDQQTRPKIPAKFALQLAPTLAPPSSGPKPLEMLNVEATLAAVKQAFLLHSQSELAHKTALQRPAQQQPPPPPTQLPPPPPPPPAQPPLSGNALPPTPGTPSSSSYTPYLVSGSNGDAAAPMSQPVTPVQNDSSRAYVPQPLHPCTAPPPSYVPCLSSGAPTLPPFAHMPQRPPVSYIPTSINLLPPSSPSPFPPPPPPPPPHFASLASPVPPPSFSRLPTEMTPYRPSPPDFYHHRPPPPPRLPAYSTDMTRPPPPSLPPPPPVLSASSTDLSRPAFTTVPSPAPSPSHLHPLPPQAALTYQSRSHRSDSGSSFESRRSPVEVSRHSNGRRSNGGAPIRQRARSPHALPHPLEHYQKCLSSALIHDAAQDRSGLGAGSSAVAAPPTSASPSATDVKDDLDTRIAKIFEAATSTKPPVPVAVAPPQEPARPPILSPPPPPPPLPVSQNVILAHRPSGQTSLLYDRHHQYRPSPMSSTLMHPQHMDDMIHHQHHDPRMAPLPPATAFTPASPIQPPEVEVGRDEFDPIQKSFLPPEEAERVGGRSADKPDDKVYSLLGI